MSVAVLEPQQQSLEELARVANAEHLAVGEHLHAAIIHAISAGEALHEAHLQIGQEGWKRWCTENLDFTPQTAGRYERLAVYKEALPAELFAPFKDSQGHVQQPSVHRALLYVRGMPRLYGQHPRAEIHAANRREARRLRAKGLTLYAIADMLGISEPTVHRYCNPDSERRYRAAHNAKRRQHREALRALEKATAMRSADPQLSELYSLVRRAVQHADRMHLAGVIAHLHRAEDEIVQALKADT